MRIEVERHLAALSGEQRVVFCPNPGNAGDSLIACATYRLLAELGLNYRPFSERGLDPRGAVLIYGGGGNWIGMESYARRFVERWHTAVKRLIVLPHTVAGNEDLLAKLGPNVDVFTREEVSFAHVQRAAPKANVYLADDLALRLRAAEFLGPVPRPWSLFGARDVPWGRRLRGAMVWMNVRQGRSRGHRVLNCFRTDRERTAGRCPAGNVDVSRVFKYGTMPAQAELATQMVFRLLNCYDEVRTNRLHLAIAGALLGKTVRFYPNSYYKCAAVYQFSMRERFPNVEWMGTEDDR